MKYDVCALGELLIDFSDNGKNSYGNILMELNPGGAPSNVLAMLSKQNKKTAFIGKVGSDMFGDILEESLKSLNIDTTGLIKDKRYNTTLAFVHRDKNGERDFSFYRNKGADSMLFENEVDFDIIKNSTIFHFGSLSMTNDICKKTTKKALKYAKENKKIISFDPNLREPLWDNLCDAKKAIDFGLKNSHIVKIADNEIMWFTGENNIEKAIEKFKSSYNIPLLLVTLGDKGSMGICEELTVKEDAIKVDTVDTTGAGDTFMGATLNFIIDNNFKKLNKDDLSKMLKYSNTAAGIITTKKGALNKMPGREEILKIL